eukprot:RCo005396
MSVEASTLLSQALRRPLLSEENELIGCLSAAGMAKLNADICQGADLERTLVELQGVFRHMQARRERAAAQLTALSEALLGQLSGPWPTEVMVLVADTPLSELLLQASRRMTTGDDLGDILEELAFEHLVKKLHMDSLRLAETYGLPVFLRCLPPTVAAVEGDAGSLTAAEMRQAKVVLGLSAVATWFDHPVPPRRSTQVMPS